MAKWRGKCARHEVWINDVDHPPPHCHAVVEGRNKTVDLYTFSIRNPPPDALPRRLRRELRGSQAELLKAWDEVKLIPPGSSTQAW